ncbi:cytochrome b/b6 domain-containing protein [Phaeobacter sp.]|uniref:cytochrome b n=1 Tax=Phaeobacter sp. TaxID=1902409 RepID=UPI0025E2557B|nr:cytochrome b/b6 domain-containing protein [Phaeobacter sp.]
MPQIPMDRYHFLARLLHWLMALGFVFMWACGYAMSSLVGEDTPLEELLFGLHISGGVTLAFLLILRIALRLVLPHPAPVAGLSRWEHIGSQLGHLALYLLPALVIAIGWAETDFGGHSVSWFGIDMPKLLPTTEVLWGWEVEEVTEVLHRWLAYGMLAVAVVHVAAVVKHRREGHDVLPRMTFR